MRQGKTNDCTRVYSFQEREMLTQHNITSGGTCVELCRWYFFMFTRCTNVGVA